MLNIHDLEKRWLQYKIKSYIPYFVLFLTLIFILTAIVFFVNDSHKVNSDINNKTKTVTAKKTLTQKVEQNQSSNTNTRLEPTSRQTQKTVQTVIANKPTYHATQIIKEKKERQNTQTVPTNHLILKPSMEFMKNLQASTPNYYHTITPIAKQKKTEKHVLKKRQKISKQKAVQEEYIDIETKAPEKEAKPEIIAPKEKIKITIKRRESENDIKEVIQRFQKNNNPALSLFAAKKYYELGNYKQAYNYALVTNKINNDIEESWLIFAKSLVKLGKKDQAIKTLREYIKFSHSANAQVLLDEIQRGKFQ